VNLFSGGGTGDAAIKYDDGELPFSDEGAGLGGGYCGSSGDFETWAEDGNGDGDIYGDGGGDSFYRDNYYNPEPDGGTVLQASMLLLHHAGVMA
jgi:hypothetical protein